jgi:hypothetical protein
MWKEAAVAYCKHYQSLPGMIRKITATSES